MGGQCRKTNVELRTVRVKFSPVRKADGPDTSRSGNLFCPGAADMCS